MHIADPAPGVAGPATATFGRREDLASLMTLLSEPGTRQVVLTGPAGVGKTHLARAAAVRVARCLVVPLAHVRDPGRVLTEVAGALGLATAPGTDLATALVHRLRGRRLLLVLDNLEHLLDAVPDVERVLDDCPHLTLLATSQVWPRDGRGRVVPVAPLALPDPGADLVTLRGEPAVALYTERARARDLGFVLDERNAPAVAALCRALEGNPLAIELAAGRAPVLPPRELVARLEAGRLELLRDARPGASARHGSLRDALAWTVDMLDPRTRRMLCWWSVLDAPLSIEAAHAQRPDPSEAERATSASTATTIDALEVLVDHHLLTPADGTDRRGFAMLDSVRAFARDLLERSGEHEAAQDLLVDWGADLGRALQRRLEGPDPGPARVELARDEDLLTGAVEAALARHRGGEAAALTLLLGERWVVAGHDPAVERLLRRVVDHLEQAGGERRGDLAHVLALSASVTARAGDPARRLEVVDLVARAVDLARAVGDHGALLDALAVRALAMPLTGDVPGAVAAVAEGVALAPAVGDERRAARFALMGAALAHVQRDDERTRALGCAGLDRARANGDEVAVVAAATILRPLVPRHPDLDDVAPTYGECRRIVAGGVLPFWEAAVLPLAVSDALAHGDLETVAGDARRCLELARGSRTPLTQGFAVACAAEVAATLGRHELAITLEAALQPTAAVRRATSAPEHLERLDAVLAASRAALGEAAARRAWRAGGACTLDDAIDLAIEGLGAHPPASGSQRADVVASVAAGSAPEAATRSGAGLTDRQREVLRLLATGLSNKEIAQRLGITPKTTMHHCAAIYRALGVRGRAEAIVRVARDGGLGRD